MNLKVKKPGEDVSSLIVRTDSTTACCQKPIALDDGQLICSECYKPNPIHTVSQYQQGREDALKELLAELDSVDVSNHVYGFEQGYLAAIEDVRKFFNYKPDEA